MGGGYLEWSSAEPLIACTWAAQFDADGMAHVERILPDGCIDLMIVNGELVIAGPDTTSVLLEPTPGARIVGVRFRPAAAPAILKVPAAAIVDQRVDAETLLGERIKPLLDELQRVKTARAAAAALGAHATRWIDRRPDLLVARSLKLMDRPIGSLADDLGVSERQLRRRFIDAIGYGPKTFQRIQRLRKFVALAAAASDPSLADLAFAAGYADQPHLARDVRELAGCTPAELLGYPVTAA